MIDVTLLSDPKLHPGRSTTSGPAGIVSFPYRSWSAVLAFQESHRSHKRWMAYVDGVDRGEWVTYSSFIHEVRQLATFLQSQGVRRGSRVVIAGHNHPQTILSYFAIWHLGACAVPLNMTEDNTRLAYIIEHCDADVILVREEYEQRVRELHPDRNFITIDNAPWAQNAPAPYHDEDHTFDDCLIVYTSGTTGNPKGVVLIQQNLFADGFDIAAWHGITEESTMMCVLPVHHVNGTIVTHVTPFLAGASVVLHRKFSASQFFPAIRHYGVHIVSVVPTLLAFLLESGADAHNVRTSGFRHIICGAGPLTCDLATRFEDSYGIRIVHGYGLSETTCYSCFLPVDLTDEEHRHWMRDYGFPSIGVAIPCNEMSIHDAQGHDVADGERGEIVIRGSNVMREYYANDKANAETFAFGWFRSGDEGFRIQNEQGQHYYFITGRLKELIIRGGVNLAPLEIDEVLNRAPGVRSGICVGFDHDMYGEEVGALVIKQNDDTNAETILAYCRQHLPFSKCPKVVVFAETLPVTSTGKYQRTKVRHLFVEWRNHTFSPPEHQRKS